MKHIAKAKIRSWYDKGIKMIFAKILDPDFFAAAMVFHLVKLSICWNENLEQVSPVGSGGRGNEVLWAKNWFGPHRGLFSLRAGSLFGGQRNVNYFLTWIIFFESAEGASFGERSEPLGERSEPAVKIESLHVSHWILNPARSSTNAALWLVKNDRLN